jgi:hypothetical protein
MRLTSPNHDSQCGAVLARLDQITYLGVTALLAGREKCAPPAKAGIMAPRKRKLVSNFEQTRTQRHG